MATEMDDSDADLSPSKALRRKQKLKLRVNTVSHVLNLNGDTCSAY